MSVLIDVTQALKEADAMVESTIDQTGPRRYALEAGMRICGIPAVRAARIDSAELIGFIFNTVEARPHQGYDELADAITSRFSLVEVTQ